jgi:UDP-glucose 4-epimerase
VATEQLAQVYSRNFALPTVCRRYFAVYGPRQRLDIAFNRLFAKRLASEPFDVFGDGNQTRDFTFVTDAVYATEAACQCGTPGRACNVGGGSRTSLNDVLKTLGSLIGSPIPRHNRIRQLGDARDTAADIRRAERHLGFEPSCDFPTGLNAQVARQRAGLASVGGYD